MTKQKAITHATEEYGGKLCKCVVCREEAVCTPSWDFYSEEPGGPLKCECCMMVNLKAVGLDLNGIFNKLEPGMRVKVVKGMLEGHEAVVRTTGRFPQLNGELSPHSVLIDVPSNTKPGETCTFGKLAGDLEIIS
jgi:hypothetical protein